MPVNVNCPCGQSYFSNDLGQSTSCPSCGAIARIAADGAVTFPGGEPARPKSEGITARPPTPAYDGTSQPDDGAPGDVQPSAPLIPAWVGYALLVLSIFVEAGAHWYVRKHGIPEMSAAEIMARAHQVSMIMGMAGIILVVSRRTLRPDHEQEPAKPSKVRLTILLIILGVLAVLFVAFLFLGDIIRLFR